MYWNQSRREGRGKGDGRGGGGGDQHDRRHRRNVRSCGRLARPHWNHPPLHPWAQEEGEGIVRVNQFPV